MIYICSKCDSQFSKWSGRCAECGEWGSLKEETANQNISLTSRRAAVKKTAVKPAGVISFAEKDFKVSYRPKIKTGLGYLDQVLGGGLTSGSLILLGGDPGVGKSTLALALAANFPEKAMYVSAEESAGQVNDRYHRLTVKEVGHPERALASRGMIFFNEDNVETIGAAIAEHQPRVAIIDSLQTIFSSEIKNQAGSPNQLKAIVSKLAEIAKTENITLLLIGHVTKEGELAGPKTLEHLVDAVLYLEGDKYKQYRLLRSVKNRFGATDEVAILEMGKNGLNEVANPSKIFLAEAREQAGSVICPVAEGSRVFLVEVQALVSKTGSGYPKRSASGFDQKRLELLTTILTKRAGINLSNFDVYVNIAGGLTLREPALDLAVCLSVISAYQDKFLAAGTVVFGEVGLGGETRAVVKTKERIKEAIKLGFKKVIMPAVDLRPSGGLVLVKEVREILKLLK